MSLLKRIFKGLQGRANDELENLADMSLVQELEQRIRDVKSDQEKVNEHTAESIGSMKVVEAEVARLKEDMDKYKSKLKEVVAEKGKDHELVGKIIEKLNSIKSTLEISEKTVEEKRKLVEKLKSQKRVNENSIKKMEIEVQSLKDQEKLISAKKANASLRSNVDGTVRTAADSMNRLKEKQAKELAMLDAAEELSESSNMSLDDEIEKSIGSGSSSVDDWLD